MIEVDSLRRGYNFGAYDGSYGIPPTQAPYPGTLGPAPIPDNHRVLIHWNQTEAAHRQQGQGQGDNKTGSRSDVEEDDDDEDRPFTPPPPRERLSYTRYQLELLNGIYIEVRYPNSTQKQLIAKRVGITREQVKIWFQNRRRKDVVGNSGKSNTSTSSSGSQDSDRQLSPAADDSNTSDDSLGSKRDSPEPKDPEDSVVPPLVMKSIINELLKFVNDPLKGRKNKKKSRAKQREKEKAAKLKKGIATTLLAGSYDMISPPNQIVPNAFFDKVKTGFNHSKGSSAFANPREGKPPTQISSVSTTSESPDTNMTSRDVTPINKYSSSHFNTSSPFPFHPHHGQGPLFPPPTSFPSHTGVPGCEIPILSDLLSLRSPIDKRKTPSSTSLPAHVTSSHAPRPTEAGSRSVPDKPFHAMNTFNSGRPLNGIFPYPFLAEQPMFMSSLRQPGEHLFRPSPHYPPAHYSEDPYQPLLISSFSNPYFTSTQASWPGPSLQNPPTSVYAPL